MSTCPSSRWQDDIASLLTASRMTHLSVGANKGYGLSEFVQRFTTAKVDNQAWHALLQKHECAAECCGICKPCRARPLPFSTRAPADAVDLHAFEVQPATAAMLRKVLADALPANASGGTAINASVHEVAVSNASGVLWTSPNVLSGKENFGASFAPSRRSIPRRAIALDDWLDAQTAEARRVQLLSIDTEGFDGLVLRGAARAISAKRIDVIEFEYIRAWHGSLRDTLRWLDGRGYTCYWVGNHGNGGVLAQASGRCWRDCFVEPRGRWSNLVCSHRADILAVFQRDVRREVRRNPGARQRVCAVSKV